MTTPKHRQSRSRSRKRRTHYKLIAPDPVACSHCHKLILPHRVCPYCGYYNGRSVVPVVEKAKKER